MAKKAELALLPGRRPEAVAEDDKQAGGDQVGRRSGVPLSPVGSQPEVEVGQGGVPIFFATSFRLQAGGGELLGLSVYFWAAFPADQAVAVIRDQRDMRANDTGR